MSTRAAIIKRTENGYTGIYCHNSGYIAGVGKTLLEHFTTNDQVDELISLGWLSSLYPRLHPIGAHSFDAPEKGTTVAYGRDRERDPDDRPGDNDPVTCATLAEVLEQIDHQFYYVHEAGRWSVNGEPLRVALASGELLGGDDRKTTAELAREEMARKVSERLHRRLFAPDLDLTGDALDQRAGDCPLLAFRF